MIFNVRGAITEKVHYWVGPRVDRSGIEYNCCKSRLNGWAFLFNLKLDEDVWSFGRLAALERSHVICLKPFEKTIEQTTETMSPSPKTITAANKQKNFKLARAATLMYRSWSAFLVQAFFILSLLLIKEQRLFDVLVFTRLLLLWIDIFPFDDIPTWLIFTSTCWT